MSDIQPGDVVVCVDASPPKETPVWIENHHGYRLKERASYRVMTIGPDLHGFGFLGVRLIGYDGGWFPERFRKIRPASEEFKQQIKACRPLVREDA